MKLDLALIKNKQDCWESIKKFLNADIETEIKSAYDFAEIAHNQQKRESGEDYIIHPAWVAKVTAQLNIGKEAVIAALLHDCVEDTSVTLEAIANKFGDEVALLVNGLTEVKSKTKEIEIHQTSIEVFRKFLFSSVDDVRILIIRIVDKLHNGLTIGYLSRERQIKFAKRSFGVYGPVAEYVGLHYFKQLLDDIAFKILEPQEEAMVKKFIKDKQKFESRAVEDVIGKIESMLKINNVNNYEIQSRIKSIYSTYQKIKNKGKERVKDRVGIRILTENIADCYTVLGLLHSSYQYLPEEFDDYISSPKPNGYKSIQTTLIWQDQLTVEIQIRTKEMHEFNEFGPASHIAYKLSRGQGTNYNWVKELVNWQKNDEAVSNYRIKVLNHFIYVFTPKGDTIQLPVGSTALDFAYKIHSDIGNRCHGAKINNKMVKIDTVLKTGDIVEIITTKKINANKNWLNLVKTQIAKEQIRKAIQLL